MLGTKTHAPRPREDLLPRPRLLPLLTDPAARLVLVTGPAGSGKTVLVRQWLDTTVGPTAWLTVDPGDNDPARFWTYFGAALGACRPDVDWPVGAQATADSLESLALLLTRSAPLALVLDDLHCLVDGAVLDQLGQLIALLPDEVRLVLVSRTYPQLRLARYQGAGQLVEIRGPDLLFSAEETELVLGRPGRDPAAAAVHDCTHGWPVAVAFAAQLPGPASGWAKPPGPTARTHQQLAGFLTEEVLRTQPEPVQGFLLDTSVLDDISVDAANALRDADDAARHLRHLERHHVFLTALDGPGEETWHTHALVRDHLRTTVARSSPDRWTELHRRAAGYYADRDPDRAIGHALTAPDPELAADLIERGADDPSGPYSRVPVTQLLRWLEALPDAVFETRAGLRSAGLTAAANWVRTDLVDRWLAARPADGPAALEEMFAEAWRADTAGDMPRVRDACLRALASCEPGSMWRRTMNGGLAGAAYMLGDWDTAAAAFVQLQRPLRDSVTRSVGLHQENLRAFPAVVHAMAGADDAADAALGRLRSWLAEAAGLGYATVGIAAWAEAMVAYFRGDVAAAVGWDRLPDDTAFAEQPLPPLVFRLDLARVRRAAGDTEQAAVLLGMVRRRLASFTDPGLVPSWVAAEEAALGIVPVPAAPAPAGAGEELSPREREVLRLLCSEFSQPEIAAHLFISYSTTKSHTRTIYRKLGVASRSAAVARARSLGYL